VGAVHTITNRPSSSLNLTAKTALKSVDFHEVTDKNMLAPFMAHGVFFAGIVAVTSSCSFPYTHDGRLYYGCTENIRDVSTDDEPFACIDDHTTAIPCDVPSGARRPNVIICQDSSRQHFPNLNPSTCSGSTSGDTAFPHRLVISNLSLVCLCHLNVLQILCFS